jgi:YihY family inner membrane protein
MRVTRWLDRFQQRHPVLGFPIAVIYKFTEDQGPYLAALITYYGFLSLFPLLLLLASVLGFVLQDDPGLQVRILDSTLSQFPLIRQQLNEPQGLRGSTAAVVVGGLVALYGALGVAQALQNAVNVSWAIPRNNRPNPVRARLRSMLLLLTAGFAVVATTVLSVLGGAANEGLFSEGGALLVTCSAIAVNTLIFAVAFRIAVAAKVSLRDVLPGAVTSAVIWQFLQLFGTAYVTNVVNDTSSAYGAFAFVLGLLAWIFFAALGVVLSIEINVVRTKRLYPRSLLTPFTDNVDLTHADQRVYADAAAAQRHKEFQAVEVTFEHGGQNASARRRAAEERLAAQSEHVVRDGE